MIGDREFGRLFFFPIMGLPILAFVSAAESLRTSWWQVVLVIVISFIGILLGWSGYRFRLMIENLKIPEKVSPEEGLDFFQAMIAQKISSIRSHTQFGVGVIRAAEMSPNDLYEFIKLRQRGESDGIIRVKDWVGIVISGEPEGLDGAFARWAEELKIPLICGATFYPDYARTSIELITAAEESMQRVSTEEGGLIWAEPEADEDEGEEGSVEKKEPDAADEEAEDEEIADDPSLDPLTGVLAMDKVASYMRKFIGEYRRNRPLALFFIGINGMSDIDDLHGKEAGNAVRKAVSRLIQESLRVDDVIGRYDENEFLALLICDELQVAAIARRLRDASQQLVVHYNNRRIKVTVNVGASMCPRHGRSLPAMFGAAKGAYDLAQRRQGSMCLIAGEE